METFLDGPRLAAVAQTSGRPGVTAYLTRGAENGGGATLDDPALGSRVTLSVSPQGEFEVLYVAGSNGRVGD